MATARKSTAKSAKRSTKKSSAGFSAEERAAMKNRAQELKAERDKVDGETQLLAKIAEMQPSSRALAKRIHEIVTATAPDLLPKTWYGMPAYTRDGKNICFFRPAEKFKERYSILGFEQTAKLDDGTMWPVAFALTKLTEADEKRIRALVRQAVS